MNTYTLHQLSKNSKSLCCQINSDYWVPLEGAYPPSIVPPSSIFSFILTLRSSVVRKTNFVTISLKCYRSFFVDQSGTVQFKVNQTLEISPPYQHLSESWPNLQFLKIVMLCNEYHFKYFKFVVGKIASLLLLVLLWETKIEILLTLCAQIGATRYLGQAWFRFVDLPNLECFLSEQSALRIFHHHYREKIGFQYSHILIPRIPFDQICRLESFS